MKPMSVTVILCLVSFMHFAQEGQLQTSFGGGVIQEEFGSDSSCTFRDISLTTDNKLVVAGMLTYPGGTDIVVIRYNTDGTRDNTFSEDGRLLFNLGENDIIQNSADVMVIQSDNKIIVAGRQNSTGIIIRFNPDGSPDDSFGNNGIALSPHEETGNNWNDMVIQSEGKILIAGAIFGGNSFIIERYNMDGSADVSFGSGGQVLFANGHINEIHSLDLQEDGKIVACGYTVDEFSDNNMAVVYRFNADGSPDESFSTDGLLEIDLGTYIDANSVIVLPDNKLLVVCTGTYDSDEDIVLIRLLPDGNYDESFGTAGIFRDSREDDQNATNAELQNDGRILITGFQIPDLTQGSISTVYRYNTDGSRDNTFGTNGIATFEAGEASLFFDLVLTETTVYATGNIRTGSLFTGITAAFQINNSVLPVTLLSFTATGSGENIVLQWNTGSETSFDKFIIERSEDGNRFISIGTQAGGKTLYNFTDKVPLAINHYRLKMVDTDEQYKYSKIIMYLNNQPNPDLHLFPNPVVSNIQILASTIPGTVIRLTVYNSSGMILKQNTLKAGGNRISTSIDLSFLPGGLYIIAITDGKNSRRQTFIKH